MLAISETKIRFGCLRKIDNVKAKTCQVIMIFEDGEKELNMFSQYVDFQVTSKNIGVLCALSMNGIANQARWKWLLCADFIIVWCF